MLRWTSQVLVEHIGVHSHRLYHRWVSYTMVGCHIRSCIFTFTRSILTRTIRPSHMLCCSMARVTHLSLVTPQVPFSGHSFLFLTTWIGMSAPMFGFRCGGCVRTCVGLVFEWLFSVLVIQLWILRFETSLGLVVPGVAVPELQGALVCGGLDHTIPFTLIHQF